MATKNNKMFPKMCLLLQKVLKCTHKVSSIPNKVSNYKNVPKYVYNLHTQINSQMATKNKKCSPICVWYSKKVLKRTHKVPNVSKKV